MNFSKQQLNQFYRYAYSLSSDKDDAFDLLQSALEKYLNKKAEVKHPQAWIIQVIRNQFYDQVKRCQPELVDTEDLNIISISDDFNSLEQETINKELIGILWDELNVQDRETLYLWAVMGCTSTEIAERTQTSRGTILSRIHRIKKKLLGVTEATFKRAV